MDMNPEYSKEYEHKTLPFELVEGWDTEDKILQKQKLEALVNGEIKPHDVAIEYNKAVVQEADRKLQELLKRPNPRNLTPEEEQQGIPSTRAIAPNPSGNLEELIQWIARLCSACPPYHPGQERIIEFLVVLRGLPRREVPDGVPPEEGSSEPYPTITLWAFESLGWLAEIFRVEESACQPPLRWRNWQSSIARLTTLNIINCDFLCSLEHLLPWSREYPDLKKRPIDGPNKIGNYLIGAAQWIIYPGEGRYVYEQCKKVGEKIPGLSPREMWGMERWREWKKQFGFVAGDERFQGKYRDMARLAHEKMVEYESR